MISFSVLFIFFVCFIKSTKHKRMVFLLKVQPAGALNIKPSFSQVIMPHSNQLMTCDSLWESELKCPSAR